MKQELEQWLTRRQLNKRYRHNGKSFSKRFTNGLAEMFREADELLTKK